MDGSIKGPKISLYKNIALQKCNVKLIDVQKNNNFSN